METLDTPTSLKYNNGNLFPPNLIMIGYVILALAIFQFAIQNFLTAIILLLLSMPILFNRNIIEINPEEGYIYEYNLFVGFIKIGKKSTLSHYKYITTMPSIESSSIHASTSNSTTISNNYAVVTLFKDRLKGKRALKKYDSKNEAEEVAKNLASRLNLKYFDYDPKLVRKVLLGEITL